MKQHHFVQPPGPLGPFADRYRVNLEAQGYRFGVVQHRMTQLSQLSRWLEANSLAAVELDEDQIDLFTSERRARGAKTLTKPTSFQLPLSFLRAIGVVHERATGQGLFDALLADYARYLAQERGLDSKTVTAISSPPEGSPRLSAGLGSSGRSARPGSSPTCWESRPRFAPERWSMS